MIFLVFSPNALHEVIYKRHKELIEDKKIRNLCDKIISSNKNGKNIGMPLGDETSQVEMIAFPSKLDNLLKCQYSIKRMGHYMDDYYLLIPPDVDAQEILNIFCTKANELGLIINKNKTHIQKISKIFCYCKIKFLLTQTGHVMTFEDKKKFKKVNKNIKSFYKKLMNGELNYLDVYNSFNSVFSRSEKYDDSKRIGKLRRKFFLTFGFYPNDYKKALFLDIKNTETKRLEKRNENKNDMTYIVYKRINEKTMLGDTNIPAMTICEEKNNNIYIEGKILCLATSEIAHQHLARNNDGNGLRRGKIIQKIQKKLSKRDKDYQKRWNKIWEDKTCQQYKKIEFKDYWVWNHAFFNASILDLEYIAKLIDIKSF